MSAPRVLVEQEPEAARLLNGARVLACYHEPYEPHTVNAVQTRPLVLVLEKNGRRLALAVMSDEEGNDAGALHIYDDSDNIGAPVAIVGGAR